MARKEFFPQLLFQSDVCFSPLFGSVALIDIRDGHLTAGVHTQHGNASNKGTHCSYTPGSLIKYYQNNYETGLDEIAMRLVN